MENHKLNNLIEDSNFDSSWKENFQTQIENEEVDDFFFELSLRIIIRLDQLGWKRSRLAEELGVSKQYISKILRAKENLGIPTIYKIQKVLGIKLIEIPNLKPKKEEKAHTIRLEVRTQAHNPINSGFAQYNYPNQKQYTAKWPKDQKSTSSCQC